MAAFVKSIEKVTTTFDTTSGSVSNTVNLSKSQTYTKCVPYCTVRVTTTGSDIRQNAVVGLEMIDNSGTPAVRVHRFSNVTVSAIHVDITVIEMGSNVTVQQGSVSATGSGDPDNSATITAVTLANSFVVFSQVATTGTTIDDWNDMLYQARFTDTTTVTFDRRTGGNPDWTVYFYVVESDGTDFLTEYVEDSYTSAETGPTNLTLSNSVTLANAFVVASYESAEGADDLRDAVCNVALTATTTLTWYRNHSATPAADGTIGCWVVRASSTEYDIQRFALDLSASTTNDQTITEITDYTTKGVILNSSNIFGGTWSVESNTNGSAIEQRQNSLTFTSSTNVRATQNTAAASGGADSRLRFEVIEFELEAAAAGGIIAGTLASMGVGI